MLYILQADQLSEDREKAVKMISETDADLIVLDAFFQSWDLQAGRWTKDEICEIRKAKKGRVVLAYLSIGEAENYREYWNKEWDKNEDGIPDCGAPSFLEKENPDWNGNYKVKYWNKVWQEIILNEVEKIIQQDFDGLYLDIVDAFEYFEYDPKTDRYFDRTKNKETKQSYREDMLDFVAKIAKIARAKKKDFLIVPQNAVQLLEIKEYLKLIDAIGVEDMFTDGDKTQNKEDIDYRMAFLNRMKKAKKPIFLIEYCKEKRLQDRVRREAEKNGFILLVTNRELKSLGIMNSQKTTETTSKENEKTDENDKEKEERNGDDEKLQNHNNNDNEQEKKADEDPFADIRSQWFFEKIFCTWSGSDLSMTNSNRKCVCCIEWNFFKVN